VLLTEKAGLDARIREALRPKERSCRTWLSHPGNVTAFLGLPNQFHSFRKLDSTCTNDTQWTKIKIYNKIK
jgi:hypothetical protein